MREFMTLLYAVGFCFFSGTSFAQDRLALTAKYKASKDALDKEIADMKKFISDQEPILEKNRAYVTEKENEHNRWRGILEKCVSGESQCSSADLANFNDKKVSAWNEKVRAQTQVVDDLDNKIPNARLKLTKAQASYAASTVGEFVDNHNLELGFDRIKNITNALKADSDLAKFQKDTGDLKQRFQLLEARFQNTALGGYVQLKMQKLLSKDVICKAVNTCSDGGDPKDLAKQLLYKESVDSVIDKVKVKGSNGL
jgi:hypothetical protein